MDRFDNISAGGIFGHSNVGHIIWDEGIAQLLPGLLGSASEARRHARAAC